MQARPIIGAHTATLGGDCHTESPPARDNSRQRTVGNRTDYRAQVLPMK